MATQSDLSPSTAGHDFHAPFRAARRQVKGGTGNERELTLDLDGPPLWAHSRLLSSGGLLFVLGENLAGEDSTRICALAERHAELKPLAMHVESGKPFCGKPTCALPRQRVQAEAREIFESDHYGAIRSMFLEARALSWLAMALAGPSEASCKTPSAREVARMHEARDLLSLRLHDPSTLAQVASAVGTDDFSLKRNFKAVFGQPVYAYLLNLRLGQASRLLLDTGLSVKEIASAVGLKTFASPVATLVPLAPHPTPLPARQTC